MSPERPLGGLGLRIVMTLSEISFASVLGWGSINSLVYNPRTITYLTRALHLVLAHSFEKHHKTENLEGMRN